MSLSLPLSLFLSVVSCGSVLSNFSPCRYGDLNFFLEHWVFFSHCFFLKYWIFFPHLHLVCRGFFVFALSFSALLLPFCVSHPLFVLRLFSPKYKPTETGAPSVDCYSRLTYVVLPKVYLSPVQYVFRLLRFPNFFFSSFVYLSICSFFFIKNL